MIRALITAGTGMVAQQTNLDVIANNLANVNTAGYKSLRAEFQDMVYQTLRASGASNGTGVQAPMGLQVGLGTHFAGNAASFTQGGLQASGNPFDVAIQGEGFFSVTKADGTTAYTRDGSFKRDANGDLVTGDGLRLNPPITVPPEATSFTVSPTGIVSAVMPGEQTPRTLGNITLTMFPNPAGLMREGQNLYIQGGASGEAVTAVPGDSGSGQLQSGFIEGSNVSIVEEMVKMIMAQRAYEINSKAIQTADDMLGTLNQLKR